MSHAPPLAPPLTPLPTTRVRAFVAAAAHQQPVNFVCFNRDGRYCLTAQGRDIHLFNPYRVADDAGSGGGAGGPPRGLLIKSYVGHGYPVTQVAVSADNALLASAGGDRAAFVWDTTTGRVVRKVFGHEQAVTSVALNEEASVVFTTSNDKALRAFDLRSQSRAPVQTFADCTDNATAAIVAGDAVICSSHDGCVRTYDLRAAACVTDQLGMPVAALALSHDGHCLLASSLQAGGQHVLLERAGGTRLASYARGHTNSLYRLQPAFTSDDALVVSPSESGAIVFYDLVTGGVVGCIADAHSRVVSCVAAHPDPGTQLLLSASFDGSATLWATRDQPDELAARAVFQDRG